MIEEAVRNRRLDDQTLPLFYQRIESAPPNMHPDEKVRQALDNTLTDRLARDVAKVGRTVAGIEAAGDKFRSDIIEKGVINKAAEIGKSIVTTPFTAAGQIASGRTIESPLETGLGVAGFIPVGFGAAGLGSRLAKGALSNALARATGSRAFRGAATAIDVADVATSEEGLFDELAASGLTQGLGRLGPKRTQTVDPTQETPPEAKQPSPTPPPTPPPDTPADTSADPEQPNRVQRTLISQLRSLRFDRARSDAAELLRYKDELRRLAERQTKQDAKAEQEQQAQDEWRRERVRAGRGRRSLHTLVQERLREAEGIPPLGVGTPYQGGPTAGLTPIGEQFRTPETPPTEPPPPTEETPTPPPEETPETDTTPTPPEDTETEVEPPPPTEETEAETSPPDDETEALRASVVRDIFVKTRRKLEGQMQEVDIIFSNAIDKAVYVLGGRFSGEAKTLAFNYLKSVGVIDAEATKPPKKRLEKHRKALLAAAKKGGVAESAEWRMTPEGQWQEVPLGLQINVPDMHESLELPKPRADEGVLESPQNRWRLVDDADPTGRARLEAIPQDVRTHHEDVRTHHVRPDPKIVADARAKVPDTPIGKPQTAQEVEDARILDHDIHGIIDEITDPRVKAKTLGVYANVKKGEPVDLTGHKIDSPEAAAILGQVYRSPLIEKTWIFYLDEDGTILDYKGYTLNRTNKTTTGSISAIRSDMKRLGAARFVRLHNHPSADARFSDPDKKQVKKWRKQFGNQFDGDVIIDSGTYAYSQFVGEDIQYHEAQRLDPESVGWDTAAEPMPTGILPGDPLYKDAQPEAVRQLQAAYTQTTDILSYGDEHQTRLTTASKAVAEIGRLLKSKIDTVTILFASANNQIVSTREYTNLHTLDPSEIRRFIENEGEKWGGAKAHVIVNRGGWYKSRGEAAERFKGLLNQFDPELYFPGIESVWIDGKSMVEEPSFTSYFGSYTLGSYKIFDSQPPIAQQIHPRREAGRTTDFDAKDTGVLEQPERVATASQLAKGAYRWFSNRIKADYSIPPAPTGDVDPNIAKESIVSKTVSPAAKSAYENTRRFFAAGMTELKGMGLGNVADELERNLQIDASRMANQWIQQLNPIYDDLNKLVNRKFGETGESRPAIRARVHQLMWNYTEYADRIEINDPEIRALADRFRTQWRELVAETNHLFYRDLPKHLQENYGETFYKFDANFNAVPWTPDITGFGHNPDTGNFISEDGIEMGMERALETSEGTYMPHFFPQEYWQQRVKKVLNRIDRLAGARGNPKAAIPGIIFNKDLDQYIRRRDGKTFDSANRTDAIDQEIEFQKKVLDNARSQAELSRPDIRDRVGSLERTRETRESNYVRNLDLIPVHLMEIARRYHEIKMFGQRNPFTNELPRYEAYIKQAKEAVQSDRERAVQTVYDHLTQFPKFEQLGAIQFRNRQESAAVLNQMADVDVERLKRDLPDLDVDLLTRIGFFRQNPDGTHRLNEGDAYRHFAWFNDIQNKRTNAMRSVLEGMTNWSWKNPTDAEYNKFWRTMSDITSGLTLNPMTSVRNVSTELPLLASMVGPGNFAQSLKMFLTDTEIRDLAKMTHSGGLQASQYFTEGTRFASTYLKGILYTGSEGFVRNVGVVAGRLAAKKSIVDYIQNPNQANRAQLEYLKMDTALIDEYISAHGNSTTALERLFQEADQRTLKAYTMVGGKRNVNAPAASNPFVDRLGDEISRTAAYVSDTIFKPYNRLSQPQFLSSANPVERTLFKFKSWIAQTFRLIRQSITDSVDQAKQGNYKPTFNLIASFGMMGLGAMATKTLFDALAGREEREGFSALGFIDGLAASGAMHAFSLIWEQIRYADGNTFKAYNSLLSLLSSPTAGVASQIGSQLLTGDVKGAAAETARVFPVTREALRLRGLLPKEEGEQQDE